MADVTREEALQNMQKCLSYFGDKNSTPLDWEIQQAARWAQIAEALRPDVDYVRIQPTPWSGPR